MTPELRERVLTAFASQDFHVYDRVGVEHSVEFAKGAKLEVCWSDGSPEDIPGAPLFEYRTGRQEIMIDTDDLEDGIVRDNILELPGCQLWVEFVTHQPANI